MAESYESIIILLAEDDADDRMLAIRALKQRRTAIDVRTVADGEELMDYLNRRGAYAAEGEAPRPRLVLLDLNMPRKSGREALQEIKADPDLRRIPIVVLTTSDAPTDIEQSYDVGVNAYITKPPTFTGLVEAMDALDRFWLDYVRLPGVES